MSELAIKIEHVSKQYRLGAIGGGTLKGDIQTWMAKMRGKEDPNSKIGAAVYTKNEKFLALDDINLEIKKGEAVGIIGHNGAGKSTLLKLITRVTAPTTGNIYLNGRVASMLEVGTGFHPELSGRDNVYLNGAILGMSKAEIKDKFEEIVEFSEVRQFIDTPVKRYSSGMYVKLAFSVASHLDSEIMIMDEVLAVGDVKFQKKCLDKMSNAAHNEGKTVLYVSHNMETIRRLCSRVVVLDRGRIIYDGEVEKGIALYASTKNDMCTRIDYDSFTRENQYKGKSMVLNTAEFIGKNNSSFKKNEPIRIKYRITSNENIESLSLRFEIKSHEGTPIGTFFAEDIKSCKKGEQFELLYEYDSSVLAPGIYKSYITLYEKMSMCSGIDHDCVPGLCFEVLSEKDDMVWTHNWGKCIFKTPTRLM